MLRADRALSLLYESWMMNVRNVTASNMNLLLLPEMSHATTKNDYRDFVAYEGTRFCVPSYAVTDQ